MDLTKLIGELYIQARQISDELERITQERDKLAAQIKEYERATDSQQND